MLPPHLQFTHGFPAELEPWTLVAHQDVNGYVRFTATADTLRMEAIVSKDGSIMDEMTLRLR